jgi:acyl transferase domain-containing protein
MLGYIDAIVRGAGERGFTGEVLFGQCEGGLVPADQAARPGFWTAQVAAPVRFDRALDALLSEPGWRVLEVGPGEALCAIARSHPAVTAGSSTVMPVLPRTAGDADADVSQALRVAAQAWAEGHDVVWPAVRGGEAVQRAALPGYQFQRRRHWVEPRAVRSEPAAVTGTQAMTGPQPGNGTAPANGTAAGPPPSIPFSIVSWHEEPRPPHERWPEADCLLLAPADAAACLPVTMALHQAGLRPVVVRPGPRYAQTAFGFTARPADPGDLTQVLATLAGRGVRPRLLVHALSLPAAEPVSAAGADDQLEHTVYSLLALLQAGAGHPVDGQPPAALVITSRSADVTGAEPVDPVKATLHGFARSVVKAAPELGCRVIDAAEPDPEELAAEIAMWPRHEVVALRGSRRWTARNVAFDASQRADATAIRRHGVYLLTGGLGGLGMAVARGLAETGLQPRIALLGRHALPDEAGEADDERSSRLRAQIAEIESLGARVRVFACDVTDRRGLRRVLDTVTADFGPVHGVIHLAGVPGDSLVHVRTAQQASKVSADSVREVLAPKVHGTLALAEALEGRPPVGFFVCFSSRAATDGLLGSGDYAAANAFQDAYTTVLRRRGLPALSVNWPSWAEVGMAAEYGLRVWPTELGPDNCPAMDEHRNQGEPVLPGAAHVDLLLRGYRTITGTGDPVRLREIVFHQMMAGHERRHLQVRLHPDGRLETWSRPAADPGARMVRHASARVSRADQVPPRADVATLRSRLPALLGDDGGPETQLFRLGPRWDNVARTWVSGDGTAAEMLVELGLPDEFAAETAGHAAYPSLLDSAITAARRPDDGPHLPLLCDSLELYRDLPAAFLAHVRRLPSGPGVIRADVDMLAPDGAVIARAAGCTLRKLAGQPLPTRPAAGPAADEGIDPRHGARLFLTLLRSRHPGQVLVGRNAGPGSASGPAPEAAPQLRPYPVLTVADGTAPHGNGHKQNGTERTGTELNGTAPSRAGLNGAGRDGAGPDGHGAGGGQATAGGSLEDRMTAIWADAIGDPEIGLDADFFEVGGNSLTAVSLMSHITEAFGVEVSLAALFDHPTIRGLSQALRVQGAR